MRKKATKVKSKKLKILAPQDYPGGARTAKRQVIYISGPMTGYPNHNAEAFAEAALSLRNRGFIVLNPGENDGGDHSKGWHYYMKIDVQNVAKSDMLALLPGWEKSKGAQIEIALAERLEIPIYEYRGDWGEGNGVLGDLIAPRVVLRSTLEDESPSETAYRIVRNDRRADYGHPLDDYARTAGMVSAMLKHKLKEDLTPDDLIKIMLQVKISRQVHQYKLDNLVDICGYTECLHLVQEEQQRRAVYKHGCMGDD